ncbi:CoA-binding domain protein [Methanococcus maripaludis C5]|uniref:CoA-binding domain protein n=1 Tax=Methanococcus maripaludis (strain C5 / ATCC BAA-1333) TaxID=402880 RepID=A4G0I5_METM5|nr:CoA-binding protein [Methanococcus maripaludis]ABO35969.1 CoA-binding domain protein [Methanococcus maripaludis C5]
MTHSDQLQNSNHGKILKDLEIKDLLNSSKNIAVIGISKNSRNPSFFVSKYLIESGFNVYFVNPNYSGEKILDHTVYSNISEIKEKIDIVSIFVNPSRTIVIAEDAVKLGFKAFWFQLETSNRGTIDYVLKNGFDVVLEKCIMVEHQKFL